MQVKSDNFPFLQGLLDPFLRGDLDTRAFPPAVIHFLKKMASRQVGTPMSYVDESGHGRDPNRKFFCMGGFLATETDWKKFNPSWVSACEEEGLTKPFHAKDREQFRGWTEEKKRRLTRKLVGAIRDASLIPLGCVVYMPDFEALERRQFRGTKLKLRDPYFVAFQQITRALAFVADQQDYGRPLTMTYAHHPEHSRGRGGAGKLWEAVRRDAPPFVSAYMGKYVCEYPKNEPGLQAADLWVYELGHHFEVMRANRREARWPFKQFVEMGLNYRSFAHDFITYADANGVGGVGPMSRTNLGREIPLYAPNA